MNNLTTNQLEQIHRESICSSLFDPTLNINDPNTINKEGTSYATNNDNLLNYMHYIQSRQEISANQTT